MGYLQANGESNWIFKSSDTPFYATKKASDTIGKGIGVPLVTGDYVLVPQDSKQLKEFVGEMAKLELNDGYIVKKGTPGGLVPVNAADEIPSVDYIALHVTVGKS